MGIEARVVSGDALQDTVAPAPVPEPDPVPVVEEPPQEVPPEVAPPDPGPTPEEVAAKAAEDSRVAEERRVAAEREGAERKAAEQKAAAQKAERDRKDKERKEKERKEKEKAAQDKADKEKAEKAERERLAREKVEQERIEKARQQREAELDAQLAAEERRAAVRASGLQSQYAALISARIERAWKRPASATAGLDCEIRITQLPGGTVTGATVGRCNGDEVVRRSIENAVMAASPLPPPPDPALFDRELKLIFKPSNSP